MAPDYEGLQASDLPETFGRSVYEPKDGPERLALLAADSGQLGACSGGWRPR